MNERVRLGMKESKENKRSSSLSSDRNKEEEREEDSRKKKEEIERKQEERHEVRKKCKKKKFSSMEGRNSKAVEKEKSYLHMPGLEADPEPPATPPSLSRTCPSRSPASPGTTQLSPHHSLSGDKGGRGLSITGMDIVTLYGEGGSATAAILCGATRDNITEGRRQRAVGRHGLSPDQ